MMIWEEPRTPDERDLANVEMEDALAEFRRRYPDAPPDDRAEWCLKFVVVVMVLTFFAWVVAR